MKHRVCWSDRRRRRSMARFSPGGSVDSEGRKGMMKSGGGAIARSVGGKGIRSGGAGRLAGRTVGSLICATIVAAFAASSVQGQGLEEYDYDNLWLRGATGEIFLVFPHNVEEAIGFGARIDFGFLGPNVRLQARAAYWDSRLKTAEVRRFEDRIEELVLEQGGEIPEGGVDLGEIDRNSLLFGADLHWMPIARGMVRPYLGIGTELYILSGSGNAIEDTFVEDGLDLLTAGVSGVAGLEFSLDALTLYGDLRGALVADVRNVALTIGVGYIVQP